MFTLFRFRYHGDSRAHQIQERVRDQQKTAEHESSSVVDRNEPGEIHDKVPRPYPPAGLEYSPLANPTNVS